ncbi:MAG: hypothetical protein O3B84_02200, partial [Chloroflexi bacterium]|nr:hypothetical protein [Chloroflexota bacterium]
EIAKLVPEFRFMESDLGSDPDKRNYVVSNEKIEKMGYLPDVSLQQGLADLVKGFQVVRRNQYANV